MWACNRGLKTIPQKSPGLQYKSFENTVGKEKLVRNEQFLLFPQCFLPIWRIFYHFHQVWNCHLQTVSVWKRLKFVIWKRVNKSQWCVIPS